MAEEAQTSPWTEIPTVPLPPPDPTRGGRTLSDLRELNVGDGGDNVFRVDQQGLWLGAELYENAPFKVSMLGAVIASALTILGGTITGATIQTNAGATTGIKLDTTSFRGYNASGDNTMSISATTGYLSIFGYLASSLVRTISISGSTSQAGVGIEDLSTAEIGFQWRGPSSGTNVASREDIPAFYHLNQNCTHGDGFTSKNTDSTWDGKHFNVIPNTAKNIAAFFLKFSAWTGTPYNSQITTEGFIDFPQYSHVSEFDENPAVLASTLIAKAYWQGGGTSGTQEIRAEGADGFDDDFTYIRLSTTATASRSSELKFHRSVDIANLSRWEAILRVSTDILTTEQKWGWHYDSTHFALFRFDTALHATKLYLSYCNGGSVTDVDLNTPMPTDGSFHRYKLQAYAGSLYVYYDDALVATISMSLPSYGKSYFYVDNKSSAVERTIDVEVAKHWYGRKQST